MLKIVSAAVLARFYIALQSNNCSRLVKIMAIPGIFTSFGEFRCHSNYDIPLFGTPMQDILGYFAPPCKIFLGNTVSLMVPLGKY